MIRIFAMLSNQGTACFETALCGADDTPAARALVEAQIMQGPDSPVLGTWTDCSDNEALWPSDDDA